MPFDTPGEAIRFANDGTFGLSGAMHTRNLEWGAELAKQIDSETNRPSGRLFVLAYLGLAFVGSVAIPLLHCAYQSCLFPLN